MHREQIEKVLSALDSIYEQLGISGGYDEAARTIRSSLNQDGSAEKTAIATLAKTIGEYLFRQHGGEGFKTALRDFETFPSRSVMARALATAPDLTDDDLVALDCIKEIPKAMRASLDKAALQIRPKGGHPVIVPRSDYRKICDEIGAAVRAGKSIGEAKRLAAAAHGCSLSTINSIWRGRQGTTRP